VASGREIFLYVRSKLVDEDPYPYGPPLPRRTLRDRWEEISPPKPSVADGSEEE
jgi:hypothetical protein